MKISAGGLFFRMLVKTFLCALILSASAFAVPARADVENSPQSLPETVSADALPTWQLNGVVWSQAIVGTTVYAVGNFTHARPPGTSEGDPGSVQAKNIFAYDIRTGEPVPFDHELNAQALVVRADAAGTRLYVGGDFTMVDGEPRGHIAAFDLPSGKLSQTFKPNVYGQVRGISPTDSTVYVGGSFRSAAGELRSNLAAFAVPDGEITDWAPTSDGGYVWAMVLSPDQSRVIAAGSFTTLNGQAAPGMGSINVATGATMPWAANARIQSSGSTGAITSLNTDGTKVYGTGYAYGGGSGTFEGSFAADPVTGEIVWVQDCLGDTYDIWAMNSVVYTASHAHDCSNVGGFTDTTPRSRWFKATASPDFGVGEITRKNLYGWDFTGLKYPGLLNWYPDIAYGSYTGHKQAAWNVTGNGEFLVLGGEFPRVNGTAQQGLVRFSRRSAAPNKVGPTYSPGLDPRPVVRPDGSVEVSFSTIFDKDDKTLTYDLYRQDSSWVATFQAESLLWRPTPILHVETGLAPGSRVRYIVRAKDPSGNTQWSRWSDWISVEKPADSSFATRISELGASHHWRFEESSGVITDSIGSAHGIPSGVGQGTPGALLSETSSALTVGPNDGLSSRVISSTRVESDRALTLEAWVKPTGAGGRIIGFGDERDGDSYNYDRVLYLDWAGRPNLMINDGELRTLTAEKGVIDGAWHHLVATVDESGMQIFVDGVRVARDQRYTTPVSYKGYWRIGSGATKLLRPQPSARAMIGQIDEVAVYPRALSLAEIQQNWAASGRGDLSARPADAYGAGVVDDNPDLFWRLDSATGQADDSSGSGSVGRISSSGVRSAVGILGGQSISFRGTNGTVISQNKWVAPKEYSAELWFSTTTTRGGKLIGYGDARTGLSTNYDRHVYMMDSGQLSFGAYDGEQRTVVSDKSYNDGNWHHMVATQGPDGMRLWVDGVLVGTGPASAADSYTGYWRIGGDRVWDGSTNSYFTGTLDEVAIYPEALSENSVKKHYELGSGQSPNKPPEARFVASGDGLKVAVDGSGSLDVDGSVVSYAWDFGDGTVGSGVSAEHVYSVGGTYLVKLLVTDDRGGTGTASETVTVAAKQSQLLVQDDFARDTVSGWGSAQIGGAWQLNCKPGTRVFVSDGMATMIVSPGGGYVATLPGASNLDTLTSLSFKVDRLPSAGGLYMSLIGRSVGKGGDYRLKIGINATGLVTVFLSHQGETDRVLKAMTLKELTYAPGDVINLKLELSGTGSTQLRGKVWKAIQPEPTDWTISAGDSFEALQKPGVIGLQTYLSTMATASGSATFRFDDLKVNPIN